MLLNKSCERTLTSFMVIVATWTLVSWCFVCFSTFTMRCALGCERNVGTPLHRFPNPDKFPEQFKAWVNVMGEKLTSPEDYLQYKHKRICDIHFKTQHRNRNNRLSALAVPSLHLPMWCNESDVTSPSTSSVGLSRAETNVEQDSFAHVMIEHNYDGVMHVFPNPAKFPERFLAWVKLVGGTLETLPAYEIYKKKRICDIHFITEHRNRFRRLNALAVPTLHLPGVVTHGFPNPDKFPERFKAWVNIVGGKLETSSDYELYKQKRICDIHFIDDHRNRYKRLNALAVPYLHLGGSNKVVSGITSLATDSSTKPLAPDDITKPLPPDHITKPLAPGPTTKSLATDPSVKPVEDETSTQLGISLENYEDHDYEVEDQIVEECHSVSDASCQEYDDDLSMYLNLSNKPGENKDDADHVIPEPSDDIHEGFLCNNCSGEIKGYRYRCVQCLDYDLCPACEAKSVHCLHYVLRIPGPRPYLEIQTIVNKIREQLQYGVDAMLPSVHLDSDIKEEVEEGDPLCEHIRDTHSQDETTHDDEAQSGTESEPAAEQHDGDAQAITKLVPTEPRTEPITEAIPKSMSAKSEEPILRRGIITLDRKALASSAYVFKRDNTTIITPPERCRTLATRHLPSQHIRIRPHMTGVSNICTASRLATGSHTDSIRHAAVSTRRMPDAYTVLPITTLPDTEQTKKVLAKRNIHEGAGTEHDASPATPAKKLKVVLNPLSAKILKYKGPMFVTQLPRRTDSDPLEEAPS